MSNVSEKTLDSFALSVRCACGGRMRVNARTEDGKELCGPRQMICTNKKCDRYGTIYRCPGIQVERVGKFTI